MFRYIDYAYAVYEEKSFTRAAEKLFIAQPSLSLTIKKLEEMLGAPVFERSGKEITLTPVGERYIAAAEEILKIRRGFENELDDMLNLKKGKVMVGSTYFISSYLLPDIHRRFKEKYPHIEVQLTVESSASLSQMLEKGELDIIIDNDMQHTCDCEKTPVMKEKILLGIPQDFEVNKKYSDIRVTEKCIKDGDYSGVGRLDVAELRDEKFILLKSGNSMRKISDAIFSETGTEPQISMEFEQLITALSYAGSGFGICFVTDTVLRYGKDLPKLCCYIPKAHCAERTLYVIHKKSKYLTRAAKAFTDEVISNIKNK